MKKLKIIAVILICALSGHFTNAQSSRKVKVSNAIELTADSDVVWTAISNLGNLDTLVPEIINRTETVGNGKGSVVTLTLKANGAKVVEEITKLNNSKRVLSYKMLKTPMPMSLYKATIRMDPKGSNRFSIQFDAIFKTTEEHKQTMVNTIENFQKTLLSNIKKIYNEK